MGKEHPGPWADSSTEASRPSPGPYGVVMKLEAEGIRGSEARKVEVSLWTMGNLVEPVRLMEEMERMGVVILEKVMGKG